MLMMIKSFLQKRMEPLAKSCPIEPNAISAVALIAMLAAGFFILQNNLVIAAFFVLLSGFLDLLDGEVARVQKRETIFGSWLDKVADRVCDAIALGSVIIAGLVNPALGIITFAVIIIASYESLAVDAHTKKQIGGELSMRGLRLVVIASGLVLYQINIAFAILLVLGAIGSIDRLMVARRFLK